MSNLYIPKSKKPSSTSHPNGLPSNERFSIRTQIFYYDQVEQFKKIVEEKGGIFEGVVKCNFLNIWNDCVGFQYCCVYQYKEDIEIEVLC